MGEWRLAPELRIESASKSNRSGIGSHSESRNRIQIEADREHPNRIESKRIGSKPSKRNRVGADSESNRLRSARALFTPDPATSDTDKNAPSSRVPRLPCPATMAVAARRLQGRARQRLFLNEKDRGYLHLWSTDDRDGPPRRASADGAVLPPSQSPPVPSVDVTLALPHPDRTRRRRHLVGRNLSPSAGCKQEGESIEKRREGVKNAKVG